MGFYFGPAYHVSSDNQIRRFRVALRAAEWFFILVLIFIYLQISRNCQNRGTMSAAEWFFTLVLIFMNLQINRSYEFRGALCAAEWVFFLVLIFYASSDQQDLHTWSCIKSPF